MTEQQTVYQLLQKYELRAKKKFGQNFLVSEDILQAIVTQSNITKHTVVIEIGPGLGNLTKRLASVAKHVIAYEIDSDMIAILKEELTPFLNVTLKHQDILKANIKNDVERWVLEGYEIVVVANLPYYITSPIITALLAEKETIKRITIMMQKEVGLRLAAKPKTKDYGFLSVMVQTYANISKIIDVNRTCFYPSPNVDSVVLQLSLYQPPKYSINDESQFREFIQGIFAQKRKTVLNNLLNYSNKPKEELIQIIEKCGLLTNTRAEELTIDQMIALSSLIHS